MVAGPHWGAWAPAGRGRGHCDGGISAAFLREGRKDEAGAEGRHSREGEGVGILWSQSGRVSSLSPAGGRGQGEETVITEGQTSVSWHGPPGCTDEAEMHPISPEGAHLGSLPQIHPSSTAKSSFSLQSKPSPQSLHLSGPRSSP